MFLKGRFWNIPEIEMFVFLLSLLKGRALNFSMGEAQMTAQQQLVECWLSAECGLVTLYELITHFNAVYPKGN